VKALHLVALLSSVGLIAIACGGSSPSSIDDTSGGASDAGAGGANADGNVGSGSGDGGGTTNDGGGGGTGSDGGPTTGSDGGGPTKDAGGGADSGLLCPDEGGKYTIALEGQGCGNLSASSSECITQPSCNAFIAPLSGGGQGLGTNSPVSLGLDGSFTMGSIKEGNLDRTGCAGKWDPVKSVLVIDCGGTGTAQSCVVTMTRVSTSCK
jgi:hypothetical protein